VADLAVTDSHALIWYATKRKRKLGSKARRVFERADTGGAAVYVPSIVLVEVAEASHRGVVRFRSSFAGWCSQLLSSPHFIAVDLGVDVVMKADELYAIPERGDRLIAATAAVLGLPLMTRDPEIAGAAGVELLW
jgi:PIN domain nuclease of toxin-antitoxin system